MAFIRAISYYLPERLLDNFELSSMFPEWSIDKISSKVGIASRHLASEDETAGDLAVKAAESLFAEYGIERESVDFVLLCTQSPDYLLPTTACIIQDRLRIPQSAGALDFNLGCSGFVYGLALAKGLIAGAMAHNVLLLTAETYSKYLHPSDKGNRSIFGDGAAACLVSETGFAQIGDFVLGTDGRVTGLKCLKTKLGEDDSRGYRKPVDIPGTEHVIEADCVINVGERKTLIFLFSIRQTN